MTKAGWTFNFRMAEATREIHAAVLAGTEDTFAEFKAEAQDEAKFGRYDTHTTQRSIDTEVVDTPKGPKGKLFTQSGHGGYLEVGTKKMPAEPFIMPSFRKVMGNFFKSIAARLKG